MLTEQTQQRLQLEIWQLQKPSEVLHLLRDIGRGRVDETAQHALIDCIKNPVSQRYSPGNLYLDRLLKALILSAEDEKETVIEDVAEVHINLLLEPPKAATPWELPASWCYKTYSYGAAIPETRRCNQKSSCGAGHAEGLITLHVSQNLFEGSTGCHEWEAGFVLSEFIFSHTKLFKGRRCCELGCGPGVVGISLQRVGAGSILLTDGDGQTLLNCRHNLGINNVLVKDHDAASPSEAREETLELKRTVRARPARQRYNGVKMAEIKWENGGSLDADIFLGADLLYDPGSHAALVQLIGSSLRRGGSVEPKQMILATTMRDVASVASFLRLITDAGLYTELLGDGDLQSLTVRFQRHLDLDKMRRSILLHRITANAQTVM